MRNKTMGMLSIFLFFAVLKLSPALAAPVVGTCGATNDETVCGFEELLAGDTLTIGDKLFHNFREFRSSATGGASALSPDGFTVASHEVFGGFGITDEIGLVFFSLEETALVGGQTLSVHFEYDVTVQGPNRIVDNTLLMSGGGFADVADGAFAIVTEAVMTPEGLRLVDKRIFESEEGLVIMDHKDFAPQSSLHIVTDMNFDGGTPETGLNTQLLFLVQTFSQEVPVPAPGALLLVGTGLGGLVAAGRFRKPGRRDAGP